MDQTINNIVLLAISFLTLAKTSGVLRGRPADLDRIEELLAEVGEGARRSGEPKEFLPQFDGRREECGSQPCDPNPAPAKTLSPRQCDILNLIAHGRSNKEIARIVGIAPETVKTHVKNIFIRLSVESRAHAVSRAHNLGLVGSQYGRIHQLPPLHEYQ
jgi:LuxR family transcriptional regulator, maltose regulon positive regulatory protein